MRKAQAMIPMECCHLGQTRTRKSFQSLHAVVHIFAYYDSMKGNATGLKQGDLAG